MDWRPHPRQEECLRRSEYEVLFGGARGGGKTDAGLVWLLDGIDNPRYRALVIRKNADDLSDWVDRATRMYSGLGAKIAYRPAEVTFPSGATIKTGHLKDDQAYTKYQGHEYQRMLIEELTQIPEERRYLQLLGSCRSTIPELRPQIFASTNPGGVGHQWVKKRFIDPAPPNTPFIDQSTGRSRIFIPSLVTDNPTLIDNDPDYIKFLDGLKDTDIELWKAWRLGDWNTFAGQFFKEFRTDLHVIKPFIPSSSEFIVGGMDWGRAKPFAFYLDIVQKLTIKEVDFFRCKTFFEVYGTDKTPKDWSDTIKNKLDFYNLTLSDIAWVRCDNQIFNVGNDNSKSISDQFIDDDERWRTLLKPASKDRVGGWENLHNWLSLAPDGLPYWQITENCIHAIETIPSLVHDEIKVEDVDSEGEDHAGDAERYMKKHLKWIDAKVGGIASNKQEEKVMPVVQMGDDGKQIPIDISAFGGSDNSSRVISR